MSDFTLVSAYDNCFIEKGSTPTSLAMYLEKTIEWCFSLIAMLSKPFISATSRLPDVTSVIGQRDMIGDTFCAQEIFFCAFEMQPSQSLWDLFFYTLPSLLGAEETT